VCSAQLSNVWENPEKTLEKAEGFIAHAANSGAQLICFPEQFATGWDPLSGKNVQGLSGCIITRLQASAKANRIAVIGSLREAASQFPKNTAVTIGNNGHIISMYSKIHLFSPANEDEHFIPGTNLGIFHSDRSHADLRSVMISDSLNSSGSMQREAFRQYLCHQHGRRAASGTGSSLFRRGRQRTRCM
jgi:predicted amidohydrolase